MNQAFQKLKDTPLDGYKVVIKPLNPEWCEYNNYIADYSVEKLAVTDRLIPPYLASTTHGDHIYDDIIELVDELKPESIVDLGCGAGELLSKLNCSNKYGLNIHVGEVKHAREVYGLENVIPADLRDVDTYFRPNSIDMVVAFWTFNYLTMEDRVETLRKICRVLKTGKYFICMDERNNPKTVLPEAGVTFVESSKQTEWGKLTILIKNVQ